ncbi:MAG: TetR/AcrR family transcriptional regulator, partial [Steroidobacter sp.]
MTSNSKDSAAPSAQGDTGTAVSAAAGAGGRPQSGHNGPSRHEQVLDEAARQLNQKGVLLTSLAEIAAKLGVTRGAMYHYVADREDLVFQCYRRAAEIIARHL